MTEESGHPTPRLLDSSTPRLPSTTFLHLSDLHLVRPGGDVWGIDPLAQVRRVQARIAQLAAAPAFIVVSGDLSDDGSAESYELVKRLVAEFGGADVPVLLALGNHDQRAMFRRVVLGEAWADDAWLCNYTRLFDGLRVIVLDSLIPGEEGGAVGAAQLAWLDEELRTPAPRGNLIVLHHCCRIAGPPQIVERFVLRDADGLEAVVARHQAAILGVLAGHSHQANSALFGGVFSTTAPGVVCQLDFFGDDEIRPIRSSGFNLCQLQDGKLVVSPVFTDDGEAADWHDIEER